MTTLEGNTMTKRAYSKPKIFRVLLNHEQAVLSQCSQTFRNLRQQVLIGCRPGKCRKRRNMRNVDSTATS